MYSICIHFYYYYNLEMCFLFTIFSGYDDGSYGPILVRLAWHASATYDENTGQYGSNGATMRFDPEKSDRNNGGLDVARNFLETIKLRHDWITYADLWTLAGSAAIEALGVPT